jgi:predicted TIM-barrel fold metal-dependent hydrolase
MIINLHAHMAHPDLYNQHPHWGPFWDDGDAGETVMRIGKWRLNLTTQEALAAAKSGKIYDPKEIARRRADPAVRIAGMDSLGQDIQVISLPSHMDMYWTEPEFSVRFARHVNDVMAEYCKPFPDRLYFWAHAPLNQPAAAVQEVDRAVRELGAVGMGAGGSNFGGLEFDSEELYPVWEKLIELDVPIFVHGYNQSVAWGDQADTEKYEVTSIVGMLYDEAKCFWNLVCSGTLDRYPELKIYITHGGGMVPYQLGRFEMTNQNLPNVKNKKPFREYMKNFWFDPLIHELPMRRAVVDVIGADRLMYGDNFGGSDSIRGSLTEGMSLSAVDLAKIESENAMKLLKIKPRVTGHNSGHIRPSGPLEIF